MVIKSNSTYEFIKSLLKNDNWLVFDLSNISCNPAAELTVSSNLGDDVSQKLNEILSFPMYEYILNFLEYSSLDWVESFRITCRLENDNLFFDVVFDYSEDNCWGTYDPIYNSCVNDIYDFLEKILLNECNIDELGVEDIELIMQLSVYEMEIFTLNVCFRISDDCYLDEDEKNKVIKILPSVETSFKEVIKKSVGELNTILSSENISDYSLKMTILCARLDEIIDNLEYSSSYYKTIDYKSLKDALMDDCKYEINL